MFSCECDRTPLSVLPVRSDEFARYLGRPGHRLLQDDWRFGGSAGRRQTYGYAMFFMNNGALKQLDKADGFEVGVGPTIVVMEGKAKNSTTTTMKDDIYAFIFGQKGLMAGLGIQGNKISKFEPK